MDQKGIADSAALRANTSSKARAEVRQFVAEHPTKPWEAEPDELRRARFAAHFR